MWESSTLEILGGVLQQGTENWVKAPLQCIQNKTNDGADAMGLSFLCIKGQQKQHIFTPTNCI